MKRGAPSPCVDYRADRSRWADLVVLAHRAASSGSPADLKALSDKALTGENGWTMLAPYPRGLVCRVLTRAAWAYGRQIDPAMRAQLAPLMITSAGLVDELYQQTADAVTAAPAGMPAATPAQRLPYADA